jgi:hypothetical protein
MIIGTWNVKTLFEKGKLGQVEYQVEKYMLDICVQARWRNFLVH